MKVTIRVTVEVDPDVWVASHGCERGEVHDDVRSYFETVMLSSNAVEEGDCTVHVL